MTLSGSSSLVVPADVAGATIPAPPRTASLFACVTTLTNTLLGVSVVGVGGGFSRAGCAVGTFYLILFACLSGSGLHLLARSSMTVSEAAMARGGPKSELPPSSFRSVALVGAPRWAFLIDVAVALKCFGVATSYLVVVGDLMPTVMSHILGDSHPESLWLERRVWVTAGFLLAAPLAFSRTLGALKYTATLAIGLVIFLSGMVLSFLVFPGLDACPADLDEKHGIASSNSTSPDELVAQPQAVTESVPFDPGAAVLGGAGQAGHCFEGASVVGSVRSILQTLPLFVFCFTCHQNIFTICNEIMMPTALRVDTVIVFSMFVALTTQLAIAWGAYATFGVGVEDDLLETYPETGLLTAARVCVSMLVTSCYPLQAHPSRLCILSTWKAFAGDMRKAYSGLATSDDEQEEGEGESGEIENGSEHVGLDKTGSNSSSSNIRSDSTRGGGGMVRRRRGGRSTSGSPSSGGVASTARPTGGSAGEGLAGPLRGGEEERGRRQQVTSTVARADPPGEDEEAGPGRQETGTRTGTDSGRPLPRTGDKNLVTKSDGEGLLLPPGGAASGNDDAGGVDGGSPLSPGFPVSHARQSDVEEVAELLGEDDIWTKVAAEGGGEKEKEKEAFWTSPDGFRHLLVTAVFLGLSYAIAMTLDDLGVILEVVGATGSTTITFILPGLLYLKVHPDPHPKRSLAALQLVVGLLIIPVALTFIALGDSAERRR